MMEIERLISLVHERKALWDLKEKSYHNRNVSRKNWEQIGIEMNQNVETVKMKWRGLRDTFRKELQKLSQRKSGPAGTSKQSTWPYLKSMMFLKDQFTLRKINSTLPDDTELSEEINDIFNDEDIDDETYLNMREPLDQSPNKRSSHQPSAKRSKTNNAIERLLEMEKDKRKNDGAEKIVENADYHFLMSLLPYLKKVPEDRKMFVRNKLQQVFCDEQILEHRSVSSTPVYIVDNNSSHSLHCNNLTTGHHQPTQSTQHGANTISLTEFFPTLQPNTNQ
ncbi:uncharacterized protein LOC129909584 [Episyrphus balteatus]|uniref:uncharacterized protein LOC129909584 n=1 Tax=Episyrphus balteatus TaxID=286459 RepID=UPI0024869105|nr:uncharacterized protein LOC129909584 [Episyrphus balteatus]